MTATALSITNLVGNGVIDIPAGTPIDQSNGMVITITTTAVPAVANSDRLVLFVQSTSASDQVLTVKAGDNPPSFRSGMGDMAFTIHAASGGGFVGPLETARVLSKTNTISLTFDSGSQGYITALMLPRSNW